MSKLLVLSLFPLLWPGLGSAAVVANTEITPESAKHFKEFSHNLLLQSDLDEFSVEKGAAIASPFGVGYMLANIDQRVWNVSNEGIDYVLQSPQGKVTEEYRALIDMLNKGRMSTNSILYTVDQNVSSSLPEGSRKIKTETKLVDFIEDWKTTWLTMNSKISNQTNGRLDDQLIPKGGWWGGAFYYFTMGAFINTNHYKSSWTTPLSSLGTKRFHDGLEIPFYQAEGSFPYMEAENYTAVALSLKEGKKTVVFVMPKSPFVEFLKFEAPLLVRAGAPKDWKSEKSRKIQIPSLNITLLDQHYKKLEALGLNYTFCVDEPDSLDVANKKGSFFMGPVVQSHHIHFTPEFFEVASATGASLNSEEKMRQGAAALELQEGAHPEGPVGSEEIADPSEFVLPVEMDEALLKSLAEGLVKVEKVDVVMSDSDTNDTITAASTSSIEQVLPPANSPAATAVVGPHPTPIAKALLPRTLPAETTSAIPITPTTTSSTATNVQPSSPIVPPAPKDIVETLDENTLRFDKPFFWYLYDEDMGPLYYGTVHSVATYQKEYGIETDEDLWLYDAYKTLLWNCP